jgi:nickel-dependent lactate racemase
LSVPPQTRLLCPRGEAPVADVKAAVRAALEEPVSGKPFSQGMQSAERVLIVVSDATRDSRNSEILPVLLEALNACAVSDDRMCILVAYGAHQPMDEAQTRALLADEIVERVQVIHHDARADSDLLHLGETSRGTPVAFNRLGVEADRIILTGVIMPHYFAGFTGGPKSLCPGIAGLDTIVANHKLSIHPDPAVGLHPGCKSGVLDGNPVHEDMVEAAKMVGDNTFLLNLVLGADGVVGVVAGDMCDAHRRGCEMANEAVRAEIDSPADVVVASCGGYPADVNLVQAHKGLHHARRALRDGGRLVIIAECAGGVGSEYIERWLDYPDAKSMLEAIHAGYTLNSQTAYSLKVIAASTSVFMKSELPRVTVETIGCHPVTTWPETLEEIVGDISPAETVYVIPRAAITVPVSRNAGADSI